MQTGIITRRTVSLQNELDSSRTRYYDDLIECTAKLEPGFRAQYQQMLKKLR